jgi:hypothetical protein
VEYSLCVGGLKKEKEKGKKAGEAGYKYTEAVPSRVPELRSAVTYLQRRHSPAPPLLDNMTSFATANFRKAAAGNQSVRLKSIGERQGSRSRIWNMLITRSAGCYR